MMNITGALPSTLLSIEEYVPPAAECPNLLCLYADASFTGPLTSTTFSNSLRSIVFGVGFDQPLASWWLPPGLRSLDLSWCETWSFPIEAGVLPPSLQILKLSDNYHHIIEPDCLPTSLLHFSVGEGAFDVLRVGTLPPGLQVLSLGVCEMDCDFELLSVPGFLPPRLRKLGLPSSLVRIWTQCFEKHDYSTYKAAQELGLPPSLQEVCVNEVLGVEPGLSPEMSEWSCVCPCSKIREPPGHIVELFETGSDASID